MASKTVGFKQSIFCNEFDLYKKCNNAIFYKEKLILVAVKTNIVGEGRQKYCSLSHIKEVNEYDKVV